MNSIVQNIVKKNTVWKRNIEKPNSYKMNFNMNSATFILKGKILLCRCFNPNLSLLCLLCWLCTRIRWERNSMATTNTGSKNWRLRNIANCKIKSFVKSVSIGPYKSVRKDFPKYWTLFWCVKSNENITLLHLLYSLLS